ncbi:hypothetical protein [Nocardia sp. NPDC052566]|uniref:hypothetical protein n=1 Tax=Nocardia sp. NPDC052566 TaxID=3364330 RepID=UPI0037CC9EFD
MPTTPTAVQVAAAGIGIHAINHIVVNLIPPVGWNVGTVYHLISAPLYAALLYYVLRGRNWARITITVLLGCQIAGRGVVWALFPTAGVHAALIAGWALSVAILALLWAPRSTRRYFGPSAGSPEPHRGSPADELTS